MIGAVGPERFWATYRTLDDRRTASVDYHKLMGQLGQGRNSLGRRLRMTFDHLRQTSAK